MALSIRRALEVALAASLLGAAAGSAVAIEYEVDYLFDDVRLTGSVRIDDSLVPDDEPFHIITRAEFAMAIAQDKAEYAITVEGLNTHHHSNPTYTFTNLNSTTGIGSSTFFYATQEEFGFLSGTFGTVEPTRSRNEIIKGFDGSSIMLTSDRMMFKFRDDPDITGYFQQFTVETMLMGTDNELNSPRRTFYSFPGFNIASVVEDPPPPPPPVPLPASALLLLTGLAGTRLLLRRRGAEG